MPTTSGMKGGGYYDANSAAQRAAMEAFLPWIEEAAPGIPLAAGETFNLLDLGSSEGANAIRAADRIIAGIRAVSDTPVRVFFNDLPTSDFNSLFANLFPGGVAVFRQPDVFPCALAGSAFSRLAPERSLHAATTFNMISWLGSKPAAPLPGFILPMPPSPLAAREGVGVSEEEQAPFRRQAEKDLTRFYRARAAELRPGGCLLIQAFGRNDSVSTSHGIYDVISDALLDEIAGGLLPQRAYEATIFPIYFRTLEEVVAPLAAQTELGRSWRLEKAESREVEVPFNALRERGDVAGWAAAYAGFIRAFSEPVLAAALAPREEVKQTLDRIYDRIEKRLAADPARYELRYISVGALMTRR